MESNEINPTPSLPKFSVLQRFAVTLVGRLGGAIFMFVLGLAYGIVLPQWGFSGASTQGFAGLMAFLGFWIYLVPAMLVFGLVAKAKNDWFVAAYPIITWVFGGYIVGAFGSFVIFLSNAIPGFTGDDIYRLQGGLYLGLCYMVVYLISKPIRIIIKETVRSKKENYLAIRYVQAASLLVSVAILALPVVYGRSLLDAQTYDRAVTRVPNSENLISSSISSVRKNGSSYKLAFAEATQQTDGMYQREINIYTLKKDRWWDNDAKRACGAINRWPIESGLTGAVPPVFKTTPKGVLYAHAELQGVKRSSSSVPEPEIPYTVHRYCWVMDNYAYYFEIDDLAGLEVLERYPVEGIIDEVAVAPKYLVECSKWHNNKRNYVAPGLYCTEADRKKTEELGTDYYRRYTRTR